MSARTWNELPNGLYAVSDIQYYWEYTFKNYEVFIQYIFVDHHSVKIYVNNLNF